ncbi:protein of unknown function [Clostridium beijerinckii]|nr:protein of unknown function [Clostridium beijerinckii]
MAKQLKNCDAKLEGLFLLKGWQPVASLCLFEMNRRKIK